MADEPVVAPEELRRAFAEYERHVRVRNYKVGCVLAFVFMPAGTALDWFVYPDRVPEFFAARVLCSALLGGIWGVLHFNPDFKAYRLLGFLVAFLPLSFIAWMIYATTGANSPYYAGLNLVMLGAAILLRWTLADSILVFVATFATYLPACLLNRTPIDAGTFFNNLYFLFVTGVFIVTGSWFYNRVRFREFELRYELDANRRLLEASNAKLKQTDELKAHFFANISHELRTPLTLLLAPLETLLNRHGPALGPEVQDLLQTMQANGLKLLKLINDLLDLVKLDTRQLKLQRARVPVAEFLRGLLASAQHLAQERGLRLECAVAADTGALFADRDKLEKVFLNLLFNAIKFTPGGGRIRVDARREGGDLVVAVADTGMGIAAEHLPFVFDRFWQADSSTKRKYQGAGLGLALVKELVEAHGGSVTAASQLGRGTTFTVRLPYVEPTEPPAPEAAAEPAEAAADAATPPDVARQRDSWLEGLYRRAELFPSMTSLRDTLRPEELGAANGQPRVLIADDEPDMLRFLKAQLGRHFQVLEAVDGQQAVDKACQFLPDLVLCDMMMPEKDGLQVCRELRGRTSTQNIPIVLLTARADEATKIAALTAGASDFLTKPFSVTELHVRLKNLVETHRLQQQLAWQNRKLEATLEQLKETETQLVQSEKLASLGRLSAGIIHEINNPLNYARTAVHTLKRKRDLLPEDQRAEYAEILADVEDGVTRVSHIVSDLRSFTHPRGETEFDEVPLAQVATTALRLLSHEWKDTVRIENQIQEEHTIQGNRNRLVQVLVNLLENAFDALKRKDFPDGQPTVWLESQRDPHTTRLRVRDNGPGIPAEVLGKIFDPFFTTKDVGEGMGLGLSICYRIIEEHGGRIRVQSEPGKFCEFCLEFPSPTA